MNALTNTLAAIAQGAVNITEGRHNTFERDSRTHTAMVEICELFAGLDDGTVDALVLEAKIGSFYRDSYKEQADRACYYWSFEEMVPPSSFLTKAVCVRGVRRLIAGGGPIAALLIEDWIGDDTVYDTVAQLGLWGEIRYA